MSDRTPRRHILLPDDLFPEIDEYRYANRIETRTEAIRRLIRAGLDCLPQAKAGAAKKPARRKEAA
jgi:hypothetical protein